MQHMKQCYVTATVIVSNRATKVTEGGACRTLASDGLELPDRHVRKTRLPQTAELRVLQTLAALTLTIAPILLKDFLD